VGGTGIEPATFCVSGRRSPTELPAQLQILLCLNKAVKSRNRDILSNFQLIVAFVSAG
jgi:hypothetical protein